MGSSSILNVGQSALAAAQAGLVTTGHNIANASTPGYSRQIVVQGSAGAQNFGFGYLGKGTEIAEVRRVYSDILTSQVRSAQSSKNQLETYYTQISRINNQFADSKVGLSPVLQGFFEGIQDLAANPDTAASRQSALAAAQTLAGRFQSLDQQLKEVEEGVDSQVKTTVSTINVYAAQIAKLNDSIEKAQGGSDGKASNDLLDQRDQLITEMSKEVKVTVTKQSNSYNVFIGTGQPLVVGAKTFNLVSMASASDLSRTTVGVVSNGQTIELDESALTGGRLGGLLEFRSETLDVARNSLGRVAVGLAATFNAQHALGQDQNGDMGGNFFTIGTPKVTPRSTNDATSAAVMTATITDASALTTSDYRFQFTGGNYVLTRLSDNTQLYSNAALPDPTLDIFDGFTLDVPSGSFTDGDEFTIRPTANGAANFAVAITDISKIAAAAPIRTGLGTSNKGSASISAGSVDATYPSTALAAAVTLGYNAATGEIDTVPAGGLAGFPQAYTDGATYSFDGISFTISGTPADGDSFTISPNTNGTGDNRNAVLLGALQSTNTLAGGTATYQGAYAQLVSLVGNKSRELEVTSKAETSFLEQAVAAQQAESGVNLDEEATNLLRYQQAYQAASKVMQTANELFELLLSLGG